MKSDKLCAGNHSYAIFYTPCCGPPFLTSSKNDSRISSISVWPNVSVNWCVLCFFFLLCFLPKGRGEKKNWIPWHLLGKQHFIFTQTLTLIKSPDIWDVGKCSTNFAEEEMNSQWPGHWPGSRNKPVSGGECCSGTAAGHESSGQLSCAHKERDHWECRWFYVSHQTWKARDSPENTCF